jgi:biotin carboxyl carrier protein
MADDSKCCAPASSATRRAVVSPLPGKVLQVLVKTGDQVKQGQVVAVVEAMKMENDVKCPRDGKIVEVHTSEGQAVQRGDKLATVE